MFGIRHRHRAPRGGSRRAAALEEHRVGDDVLVENPVLHTEGSGGHFPLHHGRARRMRKP